MPEPPLNAKELLTIRLFNGMINELCAIKGLEFVTPDEYKRLKRSMLPRIAQEIENYIDGLLA